MLGIKKIHEIDGNRAAATSDVFFDQRRKKDRMAGVSVKMADDLAVEG